MTVYKIELVEKKEGRVKSDASVYKDHERKKERKTRTACALCTLAIKMLVASEFSL